MTWIEVELVARPDRNPDFDLTDELRTRAGLSNRSHMLNNRTPYHIVQGDWDRELTREEAEVVMDVLGGLRVIKHHLEQHRRA